MLDFMKLCDLLWSGVLRNLQVVVWCVFERLFLAGRGWHSKREGAKAEMKFLASNLYNSDGLRPNSGDGFRQSSRASVGSADSSRQMKRFDQVMHYIEARVGVRAAPWKFLSQRKTLPHITRLFSFFFLGGEAGEAFFEEFLFNFIVHRSKMKNLDHVWVPNSFLLPSRSLQGSTIHSVTLHPKADPNARERKLKSPRRVFLLTIDRKCTLVSQ